MNIQRISVPGCDGATVQNLLQEKGLQVLKVEIDAGGNVPLHTHACAATMVVVRGTARALVGSSDRIVGIGDIITKGPDEPHGFVDVKEPFAFISISDRAGIMRPDGWDLTYV